MSFHDCLIEKKTPSSDRSHGKAPSFWQNHCRRRCWNKCSSAHYSYSWPSQLHVWLSFDSLLPVIPQCSDKFVSWKRKIQWTNASLVGVDVYCFLFYVQRMATDYIFVCSTHNCSRITSAKNRRPMWVYAFDHAWSFPGWDPYFSYCDGRVCKSWCRMHCTCALKVHLESVLHSSWPQIDWLLYVTVLQGFLSIASRHYKGIPQKTEQIKREDDRKKKEHKQVRTHYSHFYMSPICNSNRQNVQIFITF